MTALFNFKKVPYSTSFLKTDLKGGQKQILHLKLEGFIYQNEELLEGLREYADHENIVGVFIEVDSPGGVVGTSQEIYLELKRVRDQLKKPVVAFVQNLAASGAFYAAMGASQIVATPGALLGSVGVIATFANLEKLYTWAKIKRYSITTGKFKDAGADYRSMTMEEREFFQTLLNDSLFQFKKHISEGRKLSLKNVEQISDGSVFLGTKALRLKLIDKIGTYTQAMELVGKLTDLKKDEIKLFKPRKRERFFDLIDEALQSSSLKAFKNISQKLVPSSMTAVPLYLMPGVL